MPPNATPAPAPDGETPEHAARRLFARYYRAELSCVDKPELLRGAKPGKPVPVASEYAEGPRIVAWVLPDDRKSVPGNMFAAMWPIAMEKDVFIVPMVKDGHTVDEMWVYLDGGSWATGSFGTNATVDGKDVRRLPFGDVAPLELATTRLKRLLGKATTVRAVVFVPSCNVFAVGDNAGREAAVLLGWELFGPGITGDGPSLSLDQFGQLFTHEQLASLYQ